MNVGIDIGGTTTEAVAYREGEPIGSIRRSTLAGAEQVVATAEACVRELAQSVGVPFSEIEAVGIGIPGHVEAGRVSHAVNLGITDLDLAGALGDRLGIPVRVENDVKAAALGAAERVPAESLAYLNLGTGVAAGVIDHGLPWRGATGLAGEIGHVSVVPNGKRCSCGQRGCVETLVGGASVAAAWGRPGALPVLALFDAADAGDEEARAIVDGMAFGIVRAVTLLALTFDVERIVLGGGLTALGERLLAPVQERLRSEADGSDFLRSVDLVSRISIVPDRPSVAAFGACLVGLDKEKVYG